MVFLTFILFLVIVVLIVCLCVFTTTTKKVELFSIARFALVGLTNKPIEVNDNLTIASTLYTIGCSAASWAWVHPIATSIIVIGAAAGTY